MGSPCRDLPLISAEHDTQFALSVQEPEGISRVLSSGTWEILMQEFLILTFPGLRE